MELSELLGKKISPDLFNDLIVDSRVSFTYKDVSNPTYKSTSDNSDNANSLNNDSNNPYDSLSDKDKEKELNDLIDSVKENEDIVTKLEDLRDTMLADMNIPPDNDMVADAAKKLGSPDGNITFDIFKKAEVITDPLTIVVTQQGKVPQLEALLGALNIDGPLSKCSGVDEDFFDKLKINMGNPKADPKTSTTDEMAKFKNKTDSMFRQIFAIMWWENIWPRLVGLVLKMVGLLAKPIDAPFCLLRFKKLTVDNFNKYGPVHKILNLLAIILLCKVPIAATKNTPSYTYKAPVDYEVYFRKKMMSIASVCKLSSECPDCTPDKDNVDTNGDINDPGDSKPNKIQLTGAELDKDFPEKDINNPCNLHNNWGSDVPEKGPGVSMDCFEAAQVVMNYVADKALNDGGYTIEDSALNKILSTQASSGAVQGALDANK